jgi:PhnB protein
VASRLNPYLNFDGNTRQALEFYESVFGGSLTIHTFGEFGAPDPSLADKIMHGMLETPTGFTLMAADLPPGMAHNPGSNITIGLSGDDTDALRGYWEKLSASGTVQVPLEKQMWGDEFGSLLDQFGIPWLVNIVAPQA